MEDSFDVKSAAIAQSIVECDAQCKRILSHKPVLARILKEYMTEYAECSLEDIREKYIEGTPKVSKTVVHPKDILFIGGVNTEDVSLDEGKVIFDILFTARLPHSEERVGLVINIEAQTNISSKYPLTKRAFYYCSRLISSQHGRYFQNSNYGAIRKVYSVWIVLRPPRKHENTVTKYSITEQNIIGDIHETVENYDLMTVIVVCIGNHKLRELQDSLRMLTGLLKEDLTSSERQIILKDYEDVSQCLLKEDSSMSSVGLGLYRAGVKDGWEEGRAEGHAEGEAVGTAKGLFVALKNLMESMNLTIVAAMDLLRIPQADRPKYEAMLNAQ